jgi:uncharacterized membrane protein YoaK (UPF0700 family)
VIPVVRRLLGVVGGSVLAGLVVQAIEALGNRRYPLPAGTNLDDLASMKQAVRLLPAGAFLFVLAAWVAGAFVGAFVASQLSGRTSKWPSVTVGLLVLSAAVNSMLTLPHPIWIWIAAFVFVPAAGVVASRLAMRHPGDADPL